MPTNIDLLEPGGNQQLLLYFHQSEELINGSFLLSHISVKCPYRNSPALHQEALPHECSRWDPKGPLSKARNTNVCWHVLSATLSIRTHTQTNTIQFNFHYFLHEVCCNVCYNWSQWRYTWASNYMKQPWDKLLHAFGIFRANKLVIKTWWHGHPPFTPKETPLTVCHLKPYQFTRTRFASSSPWRYTKKVMSFLYTCPSGVHSVQAPLNQAWNVCGLRNQLYFHRLSNWCCACVSQRTTWGCCQNSEPFVLTILWNDEILLTELMDFDVGDWYKI